MAWTSRGYPVDYHEPDRKKGNFGAKYDPSKEIDWKYLYENTREEAHY
ncbi:MAG: hypothetical protein Q9N34_02125 [Aquificota bacterium]|nr:hypothetical protein [Aquificota bacterium]